jgi:hypothetical protein
MAGSKSAVLEAIVLDLTLGAVAYTPPGTVDVALSTSAFDTAATGAACDEVTGGSYARVTVTNNLTSWPAAAGSNPAVKANGVALTFPTATADWGTVLAVYLIDPGTGAVLYGADLAAAVAVNSGSGFSIPVGQFVLSET